MKQNLHWIDLNTSNRSKSNEIELTCVALNCTAFCMNGWLAGWMDGCMHALHEWLAGWMDGWMDRKTVGQIDREIVAQHQMILSHQNRVIQGGPAPISRFVAGLQQFGTCLKCFGQPLLHLSQLNFIAASLENHHSRNLLPPPSARLHDTMDGGKFILRLKEFRF